MGLADMLIKMGIRYGSKESIELCDKIGSTLADAALYKSSKLAYLTDSYPKYNFDKVTKSNFSK